MVVQDCRISCCQIAERLGISTELADKILTQELGFSNVPARWFRRLLTPEQKRTRCSVSKSNLELFEANDDNFLARSITIDETWVHYYQPETKEQPKQWKHTSSPTSKKANVVPSAGKVMASVFWDSQHVILIKYLQKGHTVTGQHYYEQLKRLRKVIKEKRPGMLTKEVLFHQDNAPAHILLVHGNNSRLWIRTCLPSILLARPGPLRLPSFSQMKNLWMVAILLVMMTS